MRAIHAYFKGWTTVFRYKQLGMILYLSNFLLALFAALPVSGFLGRSVGQSLSLGRSELGFDYMFWGELLQNFGEQINTILDQSLFFILVFLLLSLFLTGGILQIFKDQPDRFSLRGFWDACSEYFWRILRLTFYFLLLHGLCFLIFFSLFAYMCDGFNPFLMESEDQIMDAARIILPLYVLVFTFIAMIQDYAKIHLVRQSPKWLFKTFRESFRIVFKNIGKFSFLYLLNILTFLLIFLIYWKTSDQLNGSDLTTINLLFLLGQIFVLARIALKLLNLSSATFLYEWTREGYSK